MIIEYIEHIPHIWLITMGAFAGAFVGVLVMGMVNLTRETAMNAAIRRILKRCDEEHGKKDEEK